MKRFLLTIALVTATICCLLAFTPEITSAQLVVGLQNQDVASLAFSPDGKYLLSGGHDGTIRLWEKASRKLLYLIIINEPAIEIPPGIMSVSFSPDGSVFASGIRDRTVRLWKTETGDQIRVLSGHERGLRSVAFSPDGKLLASGGHDGSVRVWTPSSNDSTGKILGKHDQDIMAIAFSPDGTLIASGSKDKTVRLWSTSSKTEKADSVLATLPQPIYSTAFSPDGKNIVVGLEGGEIDVIDAKTGERKIRYFGHDRLVSGLSFSPNGLSLASVDGEGNLHRWDIHSGQAIWKTEADAGVRFGHSGVSLSAVAFSPQGDIIACGGSPGNPRFFEASSGKYLGMLGE